MDARSFEAMFRCVFNPDPVHEAVVERLREYYNVTPDSVDNITAAKHYRKFSNWAKESGITQEQISKAKKDRRFSDIK